MFTEKLMPRFSDTDALGHINNTVIAQWFEGSRYPIFKWFTPDLNVNNWKLILAKTVVEFHAELQYGESVEIRTYISRIGNSSFDVYQEVWQKNQKRASGTAVMVHFDHVAKKSKKITEFIVKQMELHAVN